MLEEQGNYGSQQGYGSEGLKKSINEFGQEGRWIFGLWSLVFVCT